MRASPKSWCWKLWSEISLRYQIRAFRQFQIRRRAGGVRIRLPRVSWQDSRREEPAVARPIGNQLGREPTNEKRAGPIANLAPNCISEMYQLKTCFDNSRKWSRAGIVWYLNHLTVSSKSNPEMVMINVLRIFFCKRGGAINGICAKKRDVFLHFISQEIFGLHKKCTFCH